MSEFLMITGFVLILSGTISKFNECKDKRTVSPVRDNEESEHYNPIDSRYTIREQGFNWSVSRRKNKDIIIELSTPGGKFKSYRYFDDEVK